MQFKLELIFKEMGGVDFFIRFFIYSLHNIVFIQIFYGAILFYCMYDLDRLWNFFL